MTRKLVFVIAATLLLAACASAPTLPADLSHAAGFWRGLWHGLTFPFAFIGSLFNSAIGIYEVNNNGGWYDFGFFLGIGGLSSGIMRSSRRD